MSSAHLHGALFLYPESIALAYIDPSYIDIASKLPLEKFIGGCQPDLTSPSATLIGLSFKANVQRPLNLHEKGITQPTMKNT